MEKNTDRLLELTNQFLDFRKTETNGFSLSFVRTDICKVIKDNFIRFKQGGEQKKIRYKADFPSKTLFTYVDVEALNKIISNLLNNALKYAESRVSIHLFSVNEGADFTVLVKNDGYMIPHEMRNTIFQAFFRLKETQQQSGTGLGLSLSLSLAELHKGTLELKATEDDHNVFALTLPVYQETENKSLPINQNIL